MTYKEPIDNPFDPAIPQYQNETQPLDQLIRQGVELGLMRVHTWLPCKVTEVLGNQKVSIQPLLQSRYTNGKVVDLPVIQNVMVHMFMGADYSIKLPVAVGDTGIGLFCERSLDNWAVSDGGIIDPQDSRHHDLSDPIFIPGLYPFPSQTTDTTTDLIVKNGEMNIRLQKNGKIKIQNSQKELIDILDRLLNILISETFTMTMLGAQPFVTYTVEKLQVIRDDLDTLKG